ncbi:hypothetical protein ACFL6U_09910 [Planctomycetota bacterium]
MAKVTKKSAKHARPEDLGVRVSDRVQILDVRLISCHVEQTPESSSDLPKNLDLQVNTNVEQNRDLDFILVFAEFSLEIRLEDGPSKDPIVQIHAQFLLTYHIDSFDDLTDKAFRQFGEMNGVYNAWPYWREFVQNTTARMGLKSLTLPVFRVLPGKPKASPAKKAKAKAKKK